MTTGFSFGFFSHSAFKRNSHIFLSFESSPPIADAETYSFSTANLLLGFDVIGKVQNMRYVGGRRYRTSKVLKAPKSKCGSGIII